MVAQYVVCCAVFADRIGFLRHAWRERVIKARQRLLMSSMIQMFFPKVPKPNGSRKRANNRIGRKIASVKDGKNLKETKKATAEAIETLAENDEDIRDGMHSILEKLRRASIDRTLLMLGLVAIIIEIEHREGSFFWSFMDGLKTIFGG